MTVVDAQNVFMYHHQTSLESIVGGLLSHACSHCLLMGPFNLSDCLRVILGSTNVCKLHAEHGFGWFCHLLKICAGVERVWLNKA